MTIKDVEKITGLTAKSIRLYESKGLITVERNTENDYRNYSEDNIEQLKLIKILRYLDFSISDIKDILNNSPDMQALLDIKIEHYDNIRSDCELKKQLCARLAGNINDKGFINQTNEEIDFIECEEVKDLSKAVKEISMPSLSGSILITLICVAPVITMLIQIANQVLSGLFASALLSVISTVFLTYTWKNYFDKRKLYKSSVKRANKERSYLLPSIITALIFTFLIIVFMAILQEKLFATDGWIFMQGAAWAENAIIYLVTIPVAMIVLFAFIKLTKNKVAIKISKSFASVISILWIALLFCSFTSVNVVTDSKIIMHTPLNISGTAYDYSEVNSIEAGFNRKGQFYYTIEIGNRKAKFTGGTVNTEREGYSDDTYSELEELDARLVSMGIAKSSDLKSIDKCRLDERYIKRFERIIENR